MKNKIPLVAAINDMSGFGRCSLTVALPVLSAMGMQVCPLPTAILSNHTGYAECTFLDMTDEMDDYIDKWEKLHLCFDAIYTGFLGNLEQVKKILSFIERFGQADTLLLVDPAMADDGSIYATYTPQMCAEMKHLVSHASIITPNLTEACILADADYTQIVRQQKEDLHAIEEIGRTIVANGARVVVITGVKNKPGIISNVVIPQEGECFTVSSPLIQRNYAGTGDVFASVLCGYLLRGNSIRQSVEKTAAFVGQVTAATYGWDMPWRDGIAFEPFLSQL